MLRIIIYITKILITGKQSILAFFYLYFIFLWFTTNYSCIAEIIL